MDAQARKKALFRSKLNAQKKDKRIDSPLVRYNESDQPVCRVCDLVLKSESFWDAHQASRKHHEAVNNLRANAASISRVSNAKVEVPVTVDKSKPSQSLDMQNTKSKQSTELPKAQPRSSSVLPPNFFDVNENKKINKGVTLQNRSASFAQTQIEFSNMDSDRVELANGKLAESENIPPAKELYQKSTKAPPSETQSLPEGFFDDKEADLRARGVKLVKPDIKDEYKEFEKSIQDDLLDVDNRLEEEEFDAAEMIEEAESVEQKTYREKVEILRRKKTELKAARLAKRTRVSEPSRDESSSDVDDDDDDDGFRNFAVDWRAQHL